MEMVVNTTQRNRSFSNRKKTLIKYMEEIASMCDSACMIMYYPTKKDLSVWPKNDLATVNSVIDKYRSGKFPVENSGVKEVMGEKCGKAKKDLCKLRKANSEAKYPTWNELFDSFNEAQLRSLSVQLQKKARILRSRIQTMKQDQQSQELMLHNSAGYNNYNNMIDQSQPQMSYYSNPQPLQVAPPLLLLSNYPNDVSEYPQGGYADPQPQQVASPLLLLNYPDDGSEYLQGGYADPQAQYSEYSQGGYAEPQAPLQMEPSLLLSNCPDDGSEYLIGGYDGFDYSLLGYGNNEEAN